MIGTGDLKAAGFQFGQKKEQKKKASTDLPKPYPSDAPVRMHKEYYEKHISGIKNLYKDQGIELPDYFNSADSYADYRKSQKAYGGRTQQPRGAYRSAETR
jgi:hypothetical protein